MANTDYRDTDLTIINMVFNRMRFLDPESETNYTLIKNFVWEVMNELEPCFKVSVNEDGTIDESKIGQEEYYSVEMMSIIADIVSVYILMAQVGINAQGVSGGAATTRFLKRVKAGTAETEWGQFSIKEGVGLFQDATKQMEGYKKSAQRKARNLGCILDICEDCQSIDGVNYPMPLLVLSSCGCS